MLSLAAATLAAAALCWPAGSGRRRLSRPPRRVVSRSEPRGGAQGEPSARRRLGRRHVLSLLVVLSAALGALLAGPGGGLAAVMVLGTVTTRWRARLQRRTSAAAVIGLAETLEMLVAELRAGAHPSPALTAAATEGHVEVTPALAAAAAAARLGGDVPAVLRAAGPVSLRPWLGRLADAWSLADRHGMPLAELLDAVRADTVQRVRFAAEVDARLAGPRATAAVLAGLPLLGLALGQAVGAGPVRVLGQTPAGQVLLVVGAALACAGVLWSARLTAGAVAP